MSFKDMVEQDIQTVFLNNMEFAEPITIKYDGETYSEIPAVVTYTKEQSKEYPVANHTKGIYILTCNLYFDLKSTDGVQPEKGGKIFVNRKEDGLFFQPYYIERSSVSMGMVKLELEAVEE